MVSKTVKKMKALTAFGDKALTLNIHSERKYGATIKAASSKCVVLYLHHHEFLIYMLMDILHSLPLDI